jgi:hypothetical protein
MCTCCDLMQLQRELDARAVAPFTPSTSPPMPRATPTKAPLAGTGGKGRA